jgi:flagellin-like protein
MNLYRRRAVSPIIATLLLIAIAVAAGVLVYVYVNSLSGGLTSSNGNQVSQQMQLQSYTFNSITGRGTGQFVEAFMENVGGSSVSISAVYFDGNALTEWYVSGGNYGQYNMLPNSAQNCFMAIPTTVNPATVITTQSDAGSPATCTAAPTSQACTVPNECINLGAASTAETLTVGTQSSVQLVIGLNTAQTAGTTHSIKVLTTSGGVSVFTVVSGRTG